MAGVHHVKDPKGAPIARYLQDVLVAQSGNQVKVPIFTRQGAPGILDMTQDGEQVFLPLERMSTERRSQRRPYRFYGVYRMPPLFAGQIVRLRLHGNSEDEARGLNRAEQLRAIPPGDPDFPRFSARRNDAESINRALEDTFYWQRAHSVGRAAQDTNLLGFGLGLNALTWSRSRGSP